MKNLLIPKYLLSIEKMFKNKFYRTIFLYFIFLIFWYLCDRNQNKLLIFIPIILLYRIILFFKINFLFFIKSLFITWSISNILNFKEVNIIIMIKLFLDTIGYHSSKSNIYNFKILILPMFIFIFKISYIGILFSIILLIQTLLLFVLYSFMLDVIKEQKDEFKFPPQTWLEIVLTGIFNKIEFNK